MFPNQLSTQNKPLLFLEVFLTQDNFDMFENAFYNNSINPSFVPFREQGYVEYLDSEYLNEDVVPRKVYFKDEIIKILTSQRDKSIRLISDKVEDVENSGNSTFNYINNTKSKMIGLLEDVRSNNKLHQEITTILKGINHTLIELSKGRVSSRKSSIETTNKKGLFKPNIKTGKLKIIYDLTLELEILDENVVSQNDFINVFTHPDPKQIDNRIVFNIDNRIAFYFINNIKKHFSNLTPSAISISESFFSKPTENKKSILLKQNNIDKINYDLRKVDTSNSKYKDVLDAIRDMEEKYKF
ncbi:hypothetical protein [Flavobacterium acetivorans]|uniref:hypothetical protein n=1 Tax=Flavobacterium acetivorans TaxID=2893883 RepID=UPI001E567BAB|nr:hypothetical protein [Flavobacterium sp. F-29]UFH36074.1 hypothetical protein LNP19_03295 [Flavobacterium sp. F-29]